MEWISSYLQSIKSCLINKDQIPVIVFDQPLYTLAKQVQWNWKDIYIVVMMGPLFTEMATWKTLSDWPEDSVWCSVLVEAEITPSGTAQSFLHASHISRTSSARF